MRHLRCAGGCKSKRQEKAGEEISGKGAEQGHGASIAKPRLAGEEKGRHKQAAKPGPGVGNLTALIPLQIINAI